MTRRTDVIQIRVSEEEKERIVEHAKDRGKKVSDYLREAGLRVYVSEAVPPGEIHVVSPPEEEGDPPRVDKIVNVGSGRFMCPKDCRPSFRPTSDKVRCPDCMSRVVPEPE